MTKPGTSDAGKRQLRLLVVGGSEQDFADLRQLLAATNGEQLHLEHVASPEDVLDRLGKKAMTFCSAVTNRLTTLRFSCYVKCANMILAFRSFF